MSDDSERVSLPPFPAQYRASGVLLHVTSLPSPYGKQLTQRIGPELESKEKPTLAHDSSTNNLIYQYRKMKEAL